MAADARLRAALVDAMGTLDHDPRKDHAAKILSVAAASSPQPAVRGRRKNKEPTPDPIRVGKTVMAFWGSRHWRAEVTGIYLDLELAADIAIEEATGNLEHGLTAWRVDVRFLSDETATKGLLFSAITHTVPEDCRLIVSAEMEAQRRIVGEEIIGRRVIARDNDDERESMTTQLVQGIGLIESRAARSHAAALAAVEQLEAAQRRVFAGQEASSRFPTFVAELQQAFRDVVTREEQSARASFQARYVEVVSAVRELWRARDQHDVELLLTEERDRRTVIRGEEAEGRHVLALVRPPVHDAAVQVDPADMTPGPRLAHFPPPGHRVTRHKSPVRLVDRPPFRVPSSRVELCPAEKLPKPKGYRRDVTPPGPIYRDPRRLEEELEAERQFRRSTSNSRSGHTTPGRSRTPTRTVADSPPPSTVHNSTAPTLLTTPIIDSRGPTPSKPSPPPRPGLRSNSGGSGTPGGNKVLPRYMMESALRPTSLAAYWRSARMSQQPADSLYP